MLPNRDDVRRLQGRKRGGREFAPGERFLQPAPTKRCRLDRLSGLCFALGKLQKTPHEIGYRGFLAHAKPAMECLQGAGGGRLGDVGPIAEDGARPAGSVRFSRRAKGAVEAGDQGKVA